MKVLWLFNHPAPYKIDFFNELGKSIDLTILFERKTESDRPLSFYQSKAKNFKIIFLKGCPIGKTNDLDFGFIKYLKDPSFDFIVINGWSTLTEMTSIRFLKKHKIPYIFAINGGITPKRENFIKRKLKNKMISGATSYLCPDKESEKYLLHYGADSQRIHFYPYSTIFENEILAAPLSKEEKNALKEELHLPLKDTFVSVGSYIKRKNPFYLLEEIWPNVDKNKELYLLGSGPLKKKMGKIIQKNKLDNVHLIPFSNKKLVLKFFALSEASLFLTNEDIYGHVVNESFSQGTPVFASYKANAAKKLIVPNENGALFNFNEKEKLITAINSPINEEMKKKTIETAKEYTLEKMTIDHISYFKSLKK